MTVNSVNSASVYSNKISCEQCVQVVKNILYACWIGHVVE